jgi:hypothetical protein
VALQRRCRASTLAGVGGARDEDLVGAAGQPGHDLGDPGGVAWGHSLGCRPIWATAAMKLGGRPFGELRPALAWRDDLPGEWRARRRSGLADKGKNFSFRGCIRRPMGHPPGPTTWTAVRGAPPLRKKVVSSQRTTKAKARRSHSLPLLTYSRLGACGKTRVVLQNRRPDQERTKT